MFPSGQREQTVNLLRFASAVQIRPLPYFFGVIMNISNFSYGLSYSSINPWAFAGNDDADIAHPPPPVEEPGNMVAGGGINGAIGAKSAKFDTFEEVECQTCQERRYQDRSNDGAVSFQSPTNISPEASDALVRAHESEHVRNEQVNAEQKGGEVISQSVRISYARCPECGKTYASGGETTTTTLYDKKQAQGGEVGDVFDAVA